MINNKICLYFILLALNCFCIAEQICFHVNQIDLPRDYIFIDSKELVDMPLLDYLKVIEDFGPRRLSDRKG